MGLFKSRDEKKSEEIYKIIMDTLKNRGNQVYDLKVEFQEGVVTLSGVCDSEATRKKAILCAELAEGVKKVVSDPLLLSEAAVQAQAAAAPSVSPAPPAAQATPPAAPPVQTAPAAPASESPAKPVFFPAEAEAAELKPSPEPQPSPAPEPQPSPQAAERAVQPAEPVQPQAEAQIYTIKSGDTLSKIAKQFYGQANKYMVIFEANRDVIKDPDRIYPGQTIRIPPLP